jgi:hypothetical protein
MHVIKYLLYVIEIYGITYQLMALMTINFVTFQFVFTFVLKYVFFSSFIKPKTHVKFIWINEWLIMIQKI